MRQDLIFVVDDNDDSRKMFKSLLDQLGIYQVLTISSGQECINKLGLEPSTIILDLHMPTLSGMDTLKQIRQQSPKIPVIMMTCDGELGNVVEAMKLGAYDYHVKPPDYDRFMITVGNAVKQFDLGKRAQLLQNELNNNYGIDNVIGENTGLKEVFKLLDKVKNFSPHVLLTGESGTGKEVLARRIHNDSTFSDGPFIEINCGAIPESLQETELFGHKKGAFTGAVEASQGKLRAANGGTIFFDEVSELSLKTQAAILRFIQEKCFMPVGDNVKVQVDCRIISAVNVDLQEEVRKGRFREDLYYRLADFPITIPPIRDRATDLPLFFEYYINKFSIKYGKVFKKMSPSAIDVLSKYHWPGNVRELKSVLLRACILSENNLIDLDCLPNDMVMQVKDQDRLSDTNGSSFTDEFASANNVSSIENFKKASISRALELTGGNMTQAAKNLKISRSNLYLLVKKYNLK